MNIASDESVAKDAGNLFPISMDNGEWLVLVKSSSYVVTIKITCTCPAIKP